MRLTSTAFAEGSAIPKSHTADGADRSPALAWDEVPDGTKAFALICDDPDAPRRLPWVHWVLYDLPPDCRALPEGVATTADVPGGGRQGKNDFGLLGYGGPSPPRGKPHRYFFKLHALDAAVGLAAGASRHDLDRALQGHVLAEATLMGTYQR
jgi:Raf kinase inhibitor-like YbhB/YbcL family protein